MQADLWGKQTRLINIFNHGKPSARLSSSVTSEACDDTASQGNLTNDRGAQLSAPVHDHLPLHTCNTIPPFVWIGSEQVRTIGIQAKVAFVLYKSCMLYISPPPTSH